MSGAEPFVARRSPAKLLLLFSGALAFVAAGLWMAGLFGPAPNPGFAWFGWVAAAFFGLCAAAILAGFAGSGIRIRLDDDGVLSREWSDRPVPWDAIDCAQTHRLHGRNLLAVYLRDPAGHPPTRWQGRLSGHNRRLGFGEINLSATGTDKRFDELVAAFERYWLARNG